MGLYDKIGAGQMLCSNKIPILIRGELQVGFVHFLFSRDLQLSGPAKNHQIIITGVR